MINSEPPKTTYDWSDKVRREEKPIISHEIGQWCVYPNFNEIEKYIGVLKPKNFEIFRQSLSANHMGHLAEDFLMASGKLQALCYKADIEAALRTPKFGGFNYWICMIFLVRELHLWVYLIRSGRKKDTFRLRNTGAFAIQLCRWRVSKNAFLWKERP